MSRTLLEEVSPLGNVQAVVEADARTCYFYLHGAPDTNFGMRSVWVRNLKPAPERLETERMRNGEPPMNPRQFCKAAEPGRLPREETLHVCWLPEGNGAALYEGDDVVAIIPPWSGQHGFCGYARDCVGEGPVAWGMPTEPTLFRRFEDAARFWSAWNDDVWPDIQSRMIDSIASGLGRHSNYYAIDGGEWPPRALLRIPTASGTALVTIGVSILPQPNTDVGEAAACRRIELAALLPSRWDDADVKRFARYVSAQAKLPWTFFTWLGPGHTIPCDSWSSPRFTSAVLVREHPALPRVLLPPQLSDPVTMLWFLPISEAEREHAIADGSAALMATLPETRWQDA